jgi:ribokinase
MPRVKAAVVGHVEWVEFARVETVPRPGDIVHASEVWAEAAGGGAVAAVQLVNLGCETLFFTALGDDELGNRSRVQLERQGVILHAATVDDATRRAFTHVDQAGERTITVLGDKLRPAGDDASLPWEELGRCDCVYFVSGDVASLRKARRANVMVATARELPTLRRGGVQLDALIGSALDTGERYQSGELDPPPTLVVATSGHLGGWAQPGGPYGAAEKPGPIEDAYGDGDCFAAGLTFALGRGDEPMDAIALASRCGATVVTGRGPYGRQLGGGELQD